MRFAEQPSQNQNLFIASAPLNEAALAPAVFYHPPELEKTGAIDTSPKTLSEYLAKAAHLAAEGKKGLYGANQDQNGNTYVFVSALPRHPSKDEFIDRPMFTQVDEKKIAQEAGKVAKTLHEKYGDALPTLHIKVTITQEVLEQAPVNIEIAKLFNNDLDKSLEQYFGSLPSQSAVTVVTRALTFSDLADHVSPANWEEMQQDLRKFALDGKGKSLSGRKDADVSPVLKAENYETFHAMLQDVPMQEVYFHQEYFSLRKNSVIASDIYPILRSTRIAPNYGVSIDEKDRLMLSGEDAILGAIAQHPDALYATAKDGTRYPVQVVKDGRERYLQIQVVGDGGQLQPADLKIADLLERFDGAFRIEDSYGTDVFTAIRVVKGQSTSHSFDVDGFDFLKDVLWARKKVDMDYLIDRSIPTDKLPPGEKPYKLGAARRPFSAQPRPEQEALLGALDTYLASPIDENLLAFIRLLHPSNEQFDPKRLSIISGALGELTPTDQQIVVDHILKSWGICSAQHYSVCGPINRITLLLQQFGAQPDRSVFEAEMRQVDWDVTRRELKNALGQK